MKLCMILKSNDEIRAEKEDLHKELEIIKTEKARQSEDTSLLHQQTEITAKLLEQLKLENEKLHAEQNSLREKNSDLEKKLEDEIINFEVQLKKAMKRHSSSTGEPISGSKLKDGRAVATTEKIEICKTDRHRCENKENLGRQNTSRSTSAIKKMGRSEAFEEQKEKTLLKAKIVKMKKRMKASEKMIKSLRSELVKISKENMLLNFKVEGGGDPSKYQQKEK